MKKIAFISFISLGISGCVDYSARPFLSEMVDCGGGKFAASLTMCESRALMFNSFY